MQPHMLHAWCMCMCMCVCVLCMCMDMLTCCRLQPRRPHLESRVPRHTEPQARCASPPHRRPTFARSCTRWGWARRRAARWPCSRASRGSTTSRTLCKPRMSLRSDADFFGLFSSINWCVVICETLTRPQASPNLPARRPKPNHYSTAFSTHVERPRARPRPRAPRPRISVAAWLQALCCTKCIDPRP